MLYGPLPEWNTSFVTNMNGAFRELVQIGSRTYSGCTAGWGYLCGSYNLNVSKWDTSAVTDMENMFFGASAFNHPIGDWNTAQVTSMGAMFRGASAFNQDISSWTGTAATTAQGNMFLDAFAFQAKYTCASSTSYAVKPSECTTIRSDWIAPPPPPAIVI